MMRLKTTTVREPTTGTTATKGKRPMQNSVDHRALGELKRMLRSGCVHWSVGRRRPPAHDRRRDEAAVGWRIKKSPERVVTVPGELSSRIGAFPKTDALVLPTEDCEPDTTSSGAQRASRGRRARPERLWFHNSGPRRYHLTKVETAKWCSPFGSPPASITALSLRHSTSR